MRKPHSPDRCRAKWAPLVSDEPEPAATRAAVAIEDEVSYIQALLIESGHYRDADGIKPPKPKPRFVAFMPHVVRLAALNLERGATVEEIVRTLSAAMDLVIVDRGQRMYHEDTGGADVIGMVGDLGYPASSEWAVYLPKLARRLKRSLYRADLGR